MDGSIFDKELEEWNLDPTGYSFEKRIELGTQLRILKRLDEIAELLRTMKKQEKEYWETWRRAKENEK